MSYDILYFPLGANAMGGAERSIAYLCAAMQKKGKRVCILAERALQNTAYPQFLTEQGIELHWVEWAPEQGFFHNIKEAFRVFRKYPAKVVQFNISWRRGMWAIPIVARLVSGARLFGSMRAMPDPHQNVRRKKLFGFIPGLQLWHVPEVFAGWVWGHALHCTISVNGKDYPDRLVAGYGYPRERIRVVYNGVHVRKEPIAPARRAELRRDFDQNAIVVNYFGRLSAQKGIDYLIRAMARLPENYQLILLGDGPEQEELQTLTRELDLAGRVRFMGFISKLDDIVAASDIVVVPSVWYEACPRQILEAMNQGVPVVASDIGGIPELFTDGVEGLLVPPKDEHALAEAIRQIGEDPERRMRMGEAGRQYARQHYDMATIVDSYDKLYRGSL